MLVKHREQLLVVDVPECPAGLILAQEPQVGQQLAEPNVGRKSTQLSEHGQAFGLGRRDHDRVSPMLGAGPYARRSRPMTSTGTRAPGASLASTGGSGHPIIDDRMAAGACCRCCVGN